MTYRPTFLGCLFLLLALALTGCEVLGVYEYVTEHPTSLYVAVGSCIIAGVTPGLPALADWFARSRGRRYALGAWLGFAICLSIVLMAAIQRTGSATDASEQLRTKAERAMRLAEQQAADARADYETAQKAAIDECKSGRQRKCLEAEDKAERARITRAKAVAALAVAPAGEQVDPLARRLAAVLPLAETQIRLLQPLLVPFALSLLSVLFFAGWSRIDFEAQTQPSAEPPEARQSAASVPATILPPALQIAPSGRPGDVAAYLVSCTEPSVGDDIEIERTLYNSYREWAIRGSVVPLAPAAFARALAEVGRAAGIAIEIRGKEAYLLGHRLAA